MVPDILSVCPLAHYRMNIYLSNGSTVILNLEKKLRTIRFSALRDRALFESASTDGKSVRWNELVEISTSEIFDMIKNS